MQCALSEGFGKSLVCEPERRGSIGAPAPEAGGDRDVLGDLDAPGRLHTRGSCECLEGGANDRVLREALDLQLG
jgi:hypothetical protein